MGLSGNLESFGVLEILQLMALQRKSGVLRLQNTDGQQQVLFLEKGRIVATRDRRANDDDPLIRFLHGASYLNDEQMQTLSNVQKQSGRDALYVMLSGGMIGRDRLVEAVTQHTQQIVDNLLGWRHGTYDFSGDERSIPKLAFKVPLSVEELLMEGVRRMDELATIKQAVLAPDLHLMRSSDSIDRSSLSRELLVVYDLVQGSTMVETIVARSPLGEYSTYEAISALLETGSLVVDPCPPAVPADDGRQQARAPRARVPVTHRIGLAPWAMVVVACSGSLILALLLKPFLHGHAKGLLPVEVQAARFHADGALAREVYRATHGREAPTSQLIQENYLRNSGSSR
jgi:hypothetical protein